jgi:hypothetical protein
VSDLDERLIWATRGRSWGFRFLLNGGFADPLPTFERAFKGVEDEPTCCHRTQGAVALRLSDPLGRRDASGRVIPHEFVVIGDRADTIKSVKEGLQIIWPLTRETYALVWDSERPPATCTCLEPKGDD